MSALVTFVAFALFCQTISACEDSKTVVNVDVYYETLCPDSIAFITRQLGPSYDSLKDHLKVNLIPFGKASYETKDNVSYQFSCQHGSSECNGNRAQACALEVINQDMSESAEDRQERSVKFVECYMSKIRTNGISNGVDACAAVVELSESKLSEIKNCSTSVRGDQALAAYGDKTLNLSPKLSFVPTIVINNVYSEDNQSRALTGFRQLICELIKDNCDSASIC